MIDFDTLWKNHPMEIGEENPCKSSSGLPNFTNQCAIRMGVCLKKSGVDLSNCTAVRCWFQDRQEYHTIRAQELADWIKSETTQFGISSIKEKASSADYSGKQGIVFF